MLIESDRLTLTKFTKNDAHFFYDLANDPDFIKYIGDRNVNGILDAEKYIADKIAPSYSLHNFGFYVVRLKEDNSPIGMCGLIKRDWMDYVEIGFAFLKKSRGNGYAIESSIAIKKHAKEYLKIPKLSAITDINNDRSGNLLEKLGFEYNSIITYPGENLKCKLYLEI